MDIAALGWGETISIAAVFGTIWAWLRLPGAPSFRANAKGWDSRIPTSPQSTSSRSTFLWPLLLWLPVPFYAYSVSYGSVPIFLPVWKPFSYYNTRYGMELLPALAFFTSFAAQALLIWLATHRPKLRPAFLAITAILLAANIALSLLYQGPLTYVEAKGNAKSRGYYNYAIPLALAKLHRLDPNGMVLMDTSTYASIVPHAGMTYRQTINESDKQFYWAALDAPAASHRHRHRFRQQRNRQSRSRPPRAPPPLPNLPPRRQRMGPG